jgi:hypothetical protein
VAKALKEAAAKQPAVRQRLQQLQDQVRLAAAQQKLAASHASGLLRGATLAHAAALAAAQQAAAATRGAAQHSQRGGPGTAVARYPAANGYGGGGVGHETAVAVPPHLQRLRGDLETRFGAFKQQAGPLFSILQKQQQTDCVCVCVCVAQKK